MTPFSLAGGGQGRTSVGWGACGPSPIGVASGTKGIGDGGTEVMSCHTTSAVAAAAVAG
jgi:hypothetical protein